jgi:hypothetical protein
MFGSAIPLDVPLHPDLSTWLNAVEGFFAKLTRRRLKSAACSDLSLICKSPSTVSSQRQTQIPTLRVDGRPKASPFYRFQPLPGASAGSVNALSM